jgi:ABC-type uncharacterized transport system auxiliary subunit
MEKYLRSAPLLLLALLFAGCVQIRQPYIQTFHYTLEYAPPEFPALQPLPIILQVERFTASPVYETNRIVYRDRDFARDAYAYHRWRTRPANLVQNFLVRDLTHSSLFRAVFADAAINPDYVLEGTVEDFLEWDLQDQWLAVVSMTVSLSAQEGPARQRILFQENFSSRQPAARKEPQAVAEAMSRAMADIAGEIIRTVHAAIAAHKNP